MKAGFRKGEAVGYDLAEDGWNTDELGGRGNCCFDGEGGAWKADPVLVPIEAKGFAALLAGLDDVGVPNAEPATN